MARQLLRRPTVCRLYIYACSLLYSSALAFSSDVNKRFTARSSTSLSLIPIGTYTGASVSACAIRCVSRHNSHYFTLDKEINLCKCALTVIKDTGSSLLPSERLFAQVSDERCNTSADFVITAVENEQLCLKVTISESVDFATARAICEAFDNGRLFVSDTAEKMKRLRQIYESVNKGGRVDLYVGMNDIARENQFYWEDGRLVTGKERSQLFYPGQPDNGFLFRNEDCVFIWTDVFKLNDVSCSFKTGYVCEIPVV